MVRLHKNNLYLCDSCVLNCIPQCASMCLSSPPCILSKEFLSTSALTKAWWSSSPPAHLAWGKWPPLLVIFSVNVGDREPVSFFFYFLFFSPEVIFCCLFWQVISEEGSVREIAGIILASSNSYLPPPTLPQQSHLLSLLFLFLNILSLISFVAACCCCCYCLFVSFCGPFGYDFSSINLVLF